AEFPVSFEVVDINRDTQLQQDAGIRLGGSVFTRANRGQNPNSQWAWKIFFRNEYDKNGELGYDIIPGTAAQAFKSINLRSSSFDQNPMIRDPLARRMFEDMGQTSAEVTFGMVYVNGQKQGNARYVISERITEDSLQEKLNSSENWDVVTKWQNNGIAATHEPDKGHNEIYKFAVRDGDHVSFADLLDYAKDNDLSQMVHYQEMASRMDMANFVDYLMIQGFLHVRDWPQNNWAAAREQSDSDLGKWRFFTWDSESWTTDQINAAFKVPGSPFGDGHIQPLTVLYENLRANEDFLQLFSDRAYRHFFNGGALTTENMISHFDSMKDELSEVLNMSTWIRDSFAPQRPSVALASMNAQGLYSFEGPTFRIDSSPQYGGTITPGQELSLSNSLSQTGIETTLVDLGAVANIFVPTGNEFAGDTSWTAQTFNTQTDPIWSQGGISGTTGVGYDRISTDYDPYIGTDIENEIYDQSKSVFLRVPFTHDNSVTFDQLQLRIRYDDGFVAYLNGTEVFRSPNVASISPPSSASAGGHEASSVADVFDITPFEDLLVDGENVLAIHGINGTSTSSDLLFSPSLVGIESVTGTGSAPMYFTLDGTDPRAAGGAIQGTLYQTPTTLNTSQIVKARTLDNGEWSALSDVVFSVAAPADSSNLRITEINYNPHDANPVVGLGEEDVDNDQFEFIEFINVGSAAIDLTGVNINSTDPDPEDRIDFTFSPTTTLEPNQRTVIARNESAFESRYGDQVNITGFYSGKLANKGGEIIVTAANELVIQQFTYDDQGSWPGRADGKGASLEVVDTVGDYDESSNWQSSNEFGGTPGAVGTGRVYDVIINEVLSRSDGAQLDKIELYNTTGSNIDLEGWLLSNTSNNYSLFTFGSGTSIAANEYLTLAEDEFGFALDGQLGDDIWLVQGDPIASGRPSRFA
ncbi:MAG: lamin tail domain-containing protein, partial [Aeoliella sp.]